MKSKPCHRPKRTLRPPPRYELPPFDLGIPSLPERPREQRKAIHSWTQAQEAEAVDEWTRYQTQHHIHLETRAEVSFDARMIISMTAHGAIEALARIAARNVHAAELLAEIAFMSVGLLNRIAKTKPEAIRPVARMKLRWPVMTSTHPHLRDDVEWLSKRIELGEGTGLQIDKFSKWTPDPLHLIALTLLEHIARLRRPDYEPTKLVRAARALPGLNKTTLAQWWNCAERILREFRIDLLTVPALAAGIPPSRKAPANRRAYLVRRLRDKFEALALP